ncbi:DMT family transporter [Candidatus Woesebacteria bacterium]|nr:DMT family transporter [Candidatus Woesebacteria bacterium]
MSWLILSLLAVSFFVIYDVAGRYLATRSENPQAFAVIYNLGVALMSPIIFLFDQTMPTGITPYVIFMTVLGLVIWGLNGRFEYFAKKHTEASVFSIIIKLGPVISFFLALIFLGETFTYSKLAGVILIVAANIILLAGNLRHAKIDPRGVRYTLLLALILSVAWLFDAVNVKAWGVGVFCMFSFFAPVVMSSFFPTIKKKQLVRELKLTPWWQFLVLGFFNLIGYGFMLKALTLGEASNVMPIATSTTPFVVLIGILLLGERDSLARKIFSSILVLIAIYLMR